MNIMKISNLLCLLIGTSLLAVSCKRRERNSINLNEVLRSCHITNGNYIDVVDSVILTYESKVLSAGLVHRKKISFQLKPKQKKILIGDIPVGGLQEITCFSEKNEVYYRDSQRTIWDGDVSDREYFENSPFISFNDSILNFCPLLLPPRMFKIKTVDTLAFEIITCRLADQEYGHRKIYIHPRVGILSIVSPNDTMRLRKIVSTQSITLSDSFYKELYKL